MMTVVFVFFCLCSTLGRSARAHMQPLARRGFLGNVVALTVPAAVAAEDTAVADGVYRPAKESMRGKMVVITGANTGLGLESCVRLAEAGATVMGTARTVEKLKKMESAVRERCPDALFEGALLDLGSLESIDKFPKQLKKRKIDVLLLNAGQMAIPEERRTVDGVERQIGVNFLGHYALTATLVPFFKESIRVISVSSSANFGATRKDLEAAIESDDLSLPKYSQWGSYCVSKAMNILFAAELQRKFNENLKGASAVSLHPGVIATDLARYLINGPDATPTDPKATPGFLLKALSFFVLPVDQGANTQVFLAANDDQKALYYDNMKPAKPNKLALDPDLGARLFQRAKSISGKSFDFETLQ